jgi:hypothetical protein
MKGDGEKVDQQAFIFVKICGPKFFDVPVVSIPTTVTMAVFYNQHL